MKSPILRAQELLAEFLKYFNDEFEDKWVAPKNPADTNPDPNALFFYKESQEKRDAFLDFHREHSTSTSTQGPCQCSLLSDGNQFILTNDIPHDSHKYDCDCNKPIEVLVPKGTKDSTISYDISGALQDGDFDHLFTSLHSAPSIGQPSHGGSAHAGIAKWSHNDRMRNTINKTYEAMGFQKLMRLSDIHARMIISLFSYSFLSRETSCATFHAVLDAVDESKEEEVDWNEEILCPDDIDPFIEWLLIAGSKHAAGDDKQTMAKLRRNMQTLTPKSAGGISCTKIDTAAAAALFEVLFPVKFAIYSVQEGLHTLISSDTHLFREFFEESAGNEMKPAILCILVIETGHLSKTVVSPGAGAYEKGVNSLPEWVTESARQQDAVPGSVAEMILNWEDRNNNILSSGTVSKEALRFKQSKRGQWISKLPKFRDMTTLDIAGNLSNTALKFSPLGLFFGVILDTFFSNLPRLLSRWICNHRRKTHLVGCSIWDERWKEIFSFELHFIYVFRQDFFNIRSEPMPNYEMQAKTCDWVCTTLIELTTPVSNALKTASAPKQSRMARELQDHNSAQFTTTVRVIGTRVKQTIEKPTWHAFGDQTARTGKPLACAVAAIVTLVQWITGADISDHAYGRFPPMNVKGLLFFMLSSAEIAYESIDWKFLPVETTIQGSKPWKSKIFCELEIGFCWVQLDLRDSAQCAADHAVAMHIFRDWRLCDDPEENVMRMVDNRGRADFVQLKDANVKSGIDAGEAMFRLFLGATNSRIASIVKLKQRAEKNSAHAQASRTAERLASRRSERLFSLESKTIKTSSRPSQSQSCRKRGSSRSRSGMSNSDRAIKRVINRHKKKTQSKNIGS